MFLFWIRTGKSIGSSDVKPSPRPTMLKQEVKQSQVIITKIQIMYIPSPSWWDHVLRSSYLFFFFHSIIRSQNHWMYSGLLLFLPASQTRLCWSSFSRWKGFWFRHCHTLVIFHVFFFFLCKILVEPLEEKLVKMWGLLEGFIPKLLSSQPPGIP